MTSEPAGPASGVPVAADSGLDVRVERGIPRSLPPGSAVALFVFGTCFHREKKVRRLELLADGEPTEATAHGMPRVDLYNKLNPPSGWGEPPGGRGSVADPCLHSYQSGFWATMPIRMPSSGQVRLAIRATLADGTVAHAPLSDIAAAMEPMSPHGDVPVNTALAICMATYEPHAELFAAQVESIRAQTESDWVCLISDDCSSPAALEMIADSIAGDPRFVLSRSDRRIGFYRNFERSLRMLPDGIELVALSDQDDRWYPEKLAALKAALGKAQLVYSDQRLVDPEGRLLASSFWDGPRANNHTNLASLLIANTVTGAASMFRRDLLDLALPFPDTPGKQYHDHWLALAALARGNIVYVDRPLYDYVQHPGATIGHEGSNTALALRPSLVRGLTSAGAGSRVSYFFAYCRMRVLAETLLLRGARLRSGKRRILARFARSERSPVGFAWIAARRARRHLGRTETLGAERIVILGILWRRAIAVVGTIRSRPIPGLIYDAQMPEDETHADDDPAAGIDHPPTRLLREIVKPLQVSVSPVAPQRVNLLIPTIELQHLFGGYITKFNLARKLAEQGYRTRILTVDPTPSLPSSWRCQVEAYAGLEGLFDRVEVEFARDRDAPVVFHPDDVFVATTWWTAEIAAAALEQLNRSRFLYLIQEYEPYTHPMGSWAASALSTYELPHVALFSTALLRDFFAERRYGVFAAGDEQGRRNSVSFENAITAVTSPSVEEMAARERKRVLFYARPENHGARNMFELGLLGLAEAIGAGVFGPAWDFYGIGSVEGRDRSVGLSFGRELKLLSKRRQGAYADLLTNHDVGLALMCTPHPSLVPLEMASAGMLTVTNSFETKTAEAMSALSANLITKPPSVEGVAAGLREAAARVDDYGGRLAGAAVEWSRDWDDSFDAELMTRIASLLDAC